MQDRKPAPRRTRAGLTCARLLLSRLGQVGDAGVRAHEDVAGVQGSLQEALFGL